MAELSGTRRWCSAASVVSGLLHVGGFVIYAVAMAVLLVSSVRGGADVWKILSFAIFGASVLALYGASSSYHIFYISDGVHRRLRKLDHSMIYILIAGSYTPLCLVTLRGRVGWTLLGIVWALAIVGIVVKMFWIDAPAYVSALCYVLMGWLVVGAFGTLKAALGSGGTAWLVAEGVIYTIGALIYGVKALRFETRYFGSHEIFHLFVLAGTACHYVVLFGFVK